jgi:hypothetical protein
LDAARELSGRDDLRIATITHKDEALAIREIMISNERV